MIRLKPIMIIVPWGLLQETLRLKTTGSTSLEPVADKIGLILILKINFVIYM